MSNLLNPYNKGLFYTQQEDFETGDESSDSAPTGWNYSKVNDSGDGAGSSIKKSSTWFTTGSYSHRLSNGYSTSSQWNGYITTMTLYKDYDLTGVYKISVDTNQFIDLNGGMEAYIEILINSDSVYKVETDINIIETLSFDVSNYTGNNTITFKTYIHNVSSGTASKYCTLYIDNLKFENYGNVIKGYWNFGEGSGTIAYDSSVNGNNGTITGAVYSKESDGSYSLSFDGSDDYVYKDNVVDVSSLSGLTISCWMKPSSSTPDLGGLGLGTRGSGEAVIRTRTTDNNIQIVAQKYNANSAYTYGSSPWVADTWQMITGTFTNNDVVLYKDGENIGSATGSSLLSQMTGTYADKLYLGGLVDTTGSSDYAPNKWFNGRIRLPMIFNKALTPEEVKKLYQDTYIGDNND